MQLVDSLEEVIPEICIKAFVRGEIMWRSV